MPLQTADTQTRQAETHTLDDGCHAASLVQLKLLAHGAIGALKELVLSSLLATAPPCSARSRMYTSMQLLSAAGMRS